MQGFRFEPVATRPERALARPRLTALLNGRFDHRLTLVTGAAGYGKTTALALAIANNRLDPIGRDVFLGATESDADPDHLLAGLAASLGVEPGAQAVALEHVVDAVWSAAPLDVVLIIDDAHHLDTSPSVGLLGELLQVLPANGHLLLASRRPVGLQVARLRAHGELLEIGEADLQFDDDELLDLRSHRGVLDSMAELPRHAATADLCIAAGPEAGADFLWEEILSGVEPDRLEALKRCAVLTDLDDGLVVPFTDGQFTTDQLLAGLPLVDGQPGGGQRMHALLRDALLARAEPGERRKSCSIAADLERGRERLHVALSLYLDAGDPLSARATAREFVLLPMLRQTIESVAAIRRYMHASDPDCAVSAALDATATFGGSEHEMLLHYQRCVQRARSEGDDTLEALALYRIVQLQVADFSSPDPEVMERLVELAPRSPMAAGALAFTRSVLAQYEGDSAAALAELDDLRLLGSANAATLLPERLCDLARPELVGLGLTPTDLAMMQPGSEVFIAFAMWLRGEESPEFANEFVRAMVTSVLRRGYGVTSISVLGVATVIALSAGDIASARRYVEHARELATDGVAASFSMMADVAEAAVASHDGRDAEVVGLFDPVRCGIETANWPSRPHLLVVPLLYLSRPDMRPMFDRGDFGSVISVAVKAGRALVALHDASTQAEQRAAFSSAAALPWNRPNLLRAHVLPHHLTMLALAAIEGGSSAAASVLEVIPGRVDNLRRVASNPRLPMATPAAALLDGLVAPPPFTLRAHLLGPMELLRDGVVVVDDDWHRRLMVRSLFALLLERRRLARHEVIELLWPDHDDEAKALANLRTTLSTLQQILEPQRPRDAKPFLVVAEHDHLVVHDSVRSDAEEFDATMAAALADDTAGMPARALAAYHRALALYRGDYLAGIDAAWAVFTRLRLRSLAVNAACRVAELVAARGEPEESARCAQRALQLDPNSERAGRLLVAALDATGDRSAAREAATALRSMLRRLGVPPSSDTLRLLSRVAPQS